MNDTAIQTVSTSSSTVSQDDINAAVWAACDTFRGTVDPSIYKDFVLTMLFLKYVSDVWQDHYDAYKKQYGDHPELIEEMLKNERFVLPASASFYALHTLRHSPGNGERIDKALHAIEDANIGKLRDVFQDISFNSNKLGEEKQKNDLLRHLLEDFAKPELNMRPSRIGNLDVIGNAYRPVLRQGLQRSPFNSDARAVPGVVTANDLIDQATVLIEVREIAGAAHRQGVFHPLLQVAMRALDRAVFMGDTPVVAGRLHAVVGA